MMSFNVLNPQAIPVLSSADPTRAAVSGQKPEPRLAKAAQEFEASLMKELLRPMQQQSALFGTDEDSSGSNDALGSFASDALAGAISARGGFGIAHQIVEHLAPGELSSNTR
jgi:Rod binding domain-containing protein